MRASRIEIGGAVALVAEVAACSSPGSSAGGGSAAGTTWGSSLTVGFITVGSDTKTVLLAARDLSAADAFRGIHRIAELRLAARSLWQTVDAVLLPTLPAGFRSDGLPVGVTLHAPAGSDETLATLASALEPAPA